MTKPNSARYAASPCLAAEIASGYFNPLAVDPQQASDVARWRSAERARLRAARQAQDTVSRAQIGAARFFRAIGRSRASLTCDLS